MELARFHPHFRGYDARTRDVHRVSIRPAPPNDFWVCDYALLFSLKPEREHWDFVYPAAFNDDEGYIFVYLDDGRRVPQEVVDGWDFVTGNNVLFHAAPVSTQK